jgi:hypothetical protein
MIGVTMREILPAIAAGMTPILLLALIVAGVGSQAVAWRPPLLWSTPTAAEPAAIAADNASLYVAGSLLNPNIARANAPSGSVFLSRYSLSGTREWTRVFGNITDDSISGISVGSDGVYIEGYIDGNLTVRKYDLNGNEVWTRQYSRPLDTLGGISVTTTGVYVAGTTTFSGAYAQKLDFDGNTIWANQFSNSSIDVKDVYADSSGVYVVGSNVVKLGVGGNELWAHQFGLPVSIEATSVSGDGTGIIVTGWLGASISTGADAFLSKYDANGNLLWSSQFPAPDGSSVVDPVISASASGFYLSVPTIGNNFMMKYNGDGGQVWSFRTGILIDNVVGWDNGVYFSGITSGPSVGEFGSSSSLVFFGLNPPLSFAVLGAVLGASAVSIVLFVKYRKKRTALKATRRPKPSGQPDESPLPRWKPA